MKRKLDFVTNSSSTSFIISSNNEKSLKVPITIEVDLLKYLDKEISTIEDLKKYYIDDRYYNKEELEEDEQFNECEKMIKKGNKIYFLHCSDENFDDPIETLLCYQGLNDLKLHNGIKIITGEGGY